MSEKKERKVSRKIVIPGEVLTAERKKLGANVFLREGKIISSRLGLLQEAADKISVIPLEGKYLPKENDFIVGIITSEKYYGYTVDINSIYESTIYKRDLQKPLKIGTFISAKVSRVNELHEAELSNVKVLYGGEILKVSPVKIPRIIGKNNSMINLIRKYTKSFIIVGRNGLIWMNGGNIALAIEAIRIVESEAHLTNLTDRITKFLEKETKVKK
ncbi:MAG: RNA-binding protein [Candidatus Iainarchaeum archaeon]|uniref:RNA-binding protein n=1 Tax=Candidatus Iainarchaeum sp. TaxID=3101447 RepID=A0A497JL21_9ARCH|nr:MAG: RNA-binding protein [Candidatus Diapherotrites archaeon]